MKYKLGLAADPRRAWLRNYQRTVYKYMTVLYSHEYDAAAAETAAMDGPTRRLLQTLSCKQAATLLNRLVNHFVLIKRDPNCRNKVDNHTAGGGAGIVADKQGNSRRTDALESDFLHHFSLYIVYY